MKVKLTNDQEKFIRNVGKEIWLDDVVKEYETVYQLPWIFRKIAGTDEWELELLKDIPPVVREKLKKEIYGKQ